MTTGYKPCEYSPNRDHAFNGEDDRCMWCDAKPWYVSIRADHPDGAPVDPAESFAAATAYALHADLDRALAIAEDRDLYARPA